MLLDLLSTDMSVSYNVKLANRIGLHTSIYITELLNINRKAILKNKLFDSTYFKVDRDYIEARTTLDKKEQRELDVVLVNLNVLKIHPTSNDIVHLDVDALSGILLDDDLQVAVNVKRASKIKKNSKKDAVSRALKMSISVTDPELRQAYDDWIDAVLLREGWMSKPAVVNGQRVIDSYTGKDLDVALEILRIAAISGYRDIEWAIEKYEKNRVSGSVSARLNTPAYEEKPKASPKVLFTDEEY